MIKNKFVKSCKISVILILMLAVLFRIFIMMNPSITSYAVVVENAYSEDLNLTIRQNSEQTITLQHAGELSSLKISGNVIGKGTARVYLKVNDAKYLIFDNSLNKNNNLITGNIVLEENLTNRTIEPEQNITVNEINETIIENTTINNPPIWISEISSFAVDQGTSLTLNLSNYFSDADNDTISYLASSNENVNVVIDNFVSLMTVIPKPWFSGNSSITLFAGDGKELAAKEITIIVMPAVITAFEFECIETCLLNNITANEITIVAELENATLQIGSINYDVFEQVLANFSNISIIEQNITNITNETAINETTPTLEITNITIKKFKKTEVERNFKASENAEFELEFVNETELLEKGRSLAKKNFEKKLNKWAAENETVEASVIYNSNNEKISFDVEIEEAREGRFFFNIIKPRQFRPGLYTLEVNFTRSGETTIFSQDFAWGVLAINTHKSIYLPDETAKLSFAVLNDAGSVVCNAALWLEVIDPNGVKEMLSTENGKIIRTDDCYKYGDNALPDYIADYGVNIPGIYIMNLTAETYNGMRNLIDNFTVSADVDFDVERTGPTRIWPPAPYNVSLVIKANENYNGQVIEKVPSSFDISNVMIEVVEEASSNETINQLSLEALNQEKINGSLNQVERLPQIQMSVQDGDNVDNKLYKSFGFSEDSAKPRMLNQVERLPEEQVSVQDIRVQNSYSFGDESPVRGAQNSEEIIVGENKKINKNPSPGARLHENDVSVLSNNEESDSYINSMNFEENQKENSITAKITELIKSPESGGIETKKNLNFAASDFTVVDVGDHKEIIFNAKFKKGGTYKLSYTFDAPDESPQFYLLGKLDIGSFSEQRYWQIASDQILSDNDASSSINDTALSELDSAAVTISYSTDNFGVGSYVWVVNLILKDTSAVVTNINGACSNKFNVTSMSFSCPGGQSCVSNLTAGTATLDWAKSKTGTVTWNILACSGSSTSSPYNITWNETSTNGQQISWNTSLITVAVPPDTTLPSVLQQYPANNSATGNTAVTFNCSATDNTNLANISLWANFTGTWALNDSWCNVTGTDASCQWNKTLPSNTYIWGCRAFDAANNSNWTLQNWTVTVDTTAPTFSNALNSSGWQYDNVTMNITISDYAVDGYIFSTNITGTWANDSWVDITSNPATYNANTSKNISLAAGVSYGWKYYANDTAGNIGESIVYNATVKTDIMPNVSLISPADGTTSVLTNFTFKAAGTDDRALVNATLYWNYTGAWLSNGTVTVSGTSAQANFTRDNLAVNSYIWNVEFCDNNGACNFSLSNYTLTIRAANKYCAGNYTEGSDWIVSRNVTCANETIYVDTNITILNNGSLTLRNVTINFSAFADGSNFINKSPNGGLYIYDLDSNASTQEDATEIISNNTDYEYDFWVFGNGGNDNFTMQNSKVTDAGYSTKSQGIQLYNVSNVVVSGNNVSDGARYGLYLQYSTNNNITNNNINTSESSGYGIYLLSSSNSNTLQSNTITTNGGSGYGIYLWSSSNNNATSNTITTSSANGYGISLYSSSNSNTLQSNTITTNGSSGYGISLDFISNSNTIQSNTITTSGSTALGIYLVSSSNSNTLQSNTITTSNTDGVGISLVTSSNNNATSNKINATGTNVDGVYILGNSDNNILNLNNISKSGRDGIRIENSGTNIPERNNITNNIILNATEHGIFVNNTLTASQLMQSNNISYSGNFSILLNNASNITIIGGSLEYSKIGINATSSINVTITNATFVLNTLWDFYITNNSWVVSLNNSFNSSVNVTDIPNDYSNFTVMWYARANVTNSSGIHMNSSSVTSTDVLGGTGWTGTTTDGLTGWFATIDYTQNGTAAVSYNLHTAEASLTGYLANSSTYNVSIKNITGTQVDIVLKNQRKFCNGNYTEGQASWNITSNITCANQTIYVAGNITIFNNGSLTLYNVTINFSMFADGSNFINKSPNGGLYIYDLDSNASTQEDATEIISNNSDYEYDFWVFGNGLNDNLTIRNSKFTDAGYSTKSQGIQLYNVSNVVINGNNVSDGALHGLYLQYSANNNLTNNTITTNGNTAYGIYLDTSSDSNDILSNTITTSGSVGYGITVSASSNSIIQSNTITTNGSSGRGIWLDGLFGSNSNNNLTNNIITTSGSSGFGIYLSTSSNSNILQSNTITTNGSSGRGIYLDTSSNNNATSNIINATGTNADGIYILVNSDNNIINLNNISKSGRDGIRIEGSTNERNNITNNIILNSTEHGIFANNTLTASQLIQGNNISYSGNFSISLNNASNITIIGGSLEYSKIGINATNSINITVTNATFVLNTLWDFYITNNSWITSINNSFNSSVNVTDIPNDYSNFTVMWYARANVTNSSGIHMNSSSVTSTDILGGTGWTGTTTDGLTGWFATIDYIQNGTAAVSYNLHTATASLTSYVANQSTYNVSIKNITGTQVDIVLKNARTFCNGNYTELQVSWNITSNVTCANETIPVYGNITIFNNGTLTLRNVTLIFQASSDGYNFINKSPTGGLFIYDLDNNASTQEDATEINTTNSDYEFDFWVYGNSGSDNFTMQNSIVRDAGYGSKSLGMKLTNVNNVKITGNNITDGALHGLYLVTSSSNNITNNQINTTGSSGYGILLQTSSNSNISGNTITTSNTFSYGIYLLTISNSNILQSNTITTSGSSSYVIVLSTSSNNNNITNNNITSNGDSGYGIDLIASSSSNTIQSNIITTNRSFGYGILLAANLNKIYGNTIITNNATGIYLSGSSNNNITSNKINATGTAADGIYVLASSDANIIDLNNITKAGRDGIRFENSGTALPERNNITNNIILNASQSGIFINNTKTASQLIQNNNITYSGINYAAVSLNNASNITIIGGIIENNTVGINASKSINVTVANVTFVGSALWDFYARDNTWITSLNNSFNHSSVNVTRTYVADLTFAGITKPTRSHNATYGSSTMLPPVNLVNGTEFASAQYSGIGYSDDSIFNYSATRYSYHKFSFRINRSLDTNRTENFTVLWEGKAGNATIGLNASLYIWNSTQWETVANTTGDGSSDENLTKGYANATAYIDAYKMLHLLAIAQSNASSNISTDYVRVSVLLADASNFTVQWYVDVNVTDADSAAVSGATVYAYENTTGSWSQQWTDTTAGNGFTGKWATIEYVQNGTNIINYTSNFTAAGTRANSTIKYITSSQQVDVRIPGSIGTLFLILPANETKLDRDAVNSSVADFDILIANITSSAINVNITFYANLTNPNISGQTMIVLGSNLTNSSGYATLIFNPNSSLYAGNYTWWAISEGYNSSETRTLLIYGGLNTTFRNSTSKPNATYSLGEEVIIEALLNSSGSETFAQLNSTYLANVSAYLIQPNGTQIRVQLYAFANTAAGGNALNYTYTDTGIAWDNCLSNLNTLSDDSFYNYGFYDNLGWNLSYYNESANFTQICANGYIGVGTSFSGSCPYTPTDAAFKTSRYIAAFWTDLSGPGGNRVYRCEYSDHVTFRWNTTEISTSNWEDFEIILYQDGTIYYIYNTLTALTSHSVLSGISYGDGISYTIIKATNTSLPPYNNTLAYPSSGTFLNGSYVLPSTALAGQWNVTLNSSASWFFGNSSGGRNFTVVGDQVIPIVTLNLPVNDYSETSTNTITFNCSASDNVGLANITLYGNWSGWHANETKAIAGTNNSATFTKNLTNGTYVWNCLAYDNSSNSAFASANFTLSVFPKTYCNGNYTDGSDWVIGRNITCANETIYVAGNITILNNGSLTLYNVTINFSMFTNGSNFINKSPNGGLFIYDLDSNASTEEDGSWITANNTNGTFFYYDFWVFGNSRNDNFTMQNSKVTNAGYASKSQGIQLYNVSNIIIGGNNISDGARYGLYLLNSTSNNISGNTITTNGSSAYGIYFSSSPNSTFQSNTITTSNANGYGIYLFKSNNSNISNNIITTNGSSSYGLNIYLSSNSTLQSNTITTTGSNGYGIYLTSSNLNTIQANAIVTNGSNSYGIYLDSSVGANLNNSISNNTITTNNASGYGIYLYGIFSSNSNTNVANNIISTNGSSGFGIYLFSNSNSNISGNTVTTNGSSGYGIYLSASSNNNITSNTITTNGNSSHGIWFSSSSSNNATSNIINTTGTNADGIYVFSNSDNNIFNFNNISKSGKDGIRVEGSAINLPERNNITNNIILNATEHGIFVNNTLRASQLIQNNNISYSGNFSILLNNASNITIIGGSLEYSRVGLNASQSVNVTITNATFVLNTLWDFYVTNNSYITSLNNSFNKSAVNITNSQGDYSNFTVQWYVDVNVTGSDSNAVSGATVFAYENTTSSWAQEWTESTGTNGFTGKWAVTEYVQNGTNIINYTSNFTANISTRENSTIKYITSSQQVDIRIPIQTGTLFLIAPSNETKLDRDAVNSSVADFDILIANITSSTINVNITFYANLTNPNISGQTMIVLGSNLTNSSGYATLIFNPNSSLYAGNYTWWAVSSNYNSSEIRTLLIYGGLNTTFRNNTIRPNATYSPGEDVIIEALLNSLGVETAAQVNSTYLANVSAYLIQPNNTITRVQLYDPAAAVGNTSSPFSCGNNCKNCKEAGNGTIDNCYDGSTCTSNVYVNNITVVDLTDNEFSAGDTVQVNISVYNCFGPGNHEVAIAYNNGSGWANKNNSATNNGNCVLENNHTATFTLDNVAGTHNIRGIIAYNGVTNMTCGSDADTSGSDTDDINITVTTGKAFWNGSYILPSTSLSGQWNVTLNSSANWLFGNSTNGRNFNVSDTTSPIVTLNSPINYYNETSTNTITFNCSATDNVNLTNITLYGNWSGWHANETKYAAGTSNSATFTKNLTNGTYIWNCLAYDTSSNSAFASANFTLSFPRTYCSDNYAEGRNWVIGSNITCANETIPVTGNITILNNGSLTLYNATIIFQAAGDGSNFINKSPNAGLYIYDLDNNASTKEDATEINTTNSDYEFDFWIYGNGNNDNLTIRNSKIMDAGYSTGSRGVQLYNASNVIISGNNISGGSQYGLYLQYSPNNNISGNTITTTVSFGYGIYLVSSSNLSITGNTITTSGSNGIWLSSSSNSTILNNIIAANGKLSFSSMLDANYSQSINTTGYECYRITHKSNFSANQIRVAFAAGNGSFTPLGASVAKAVNATLISLNTRNQLFFGSLPYRSIPSSQFDISDWTNLSIQPGENLTIQFLVPDNSGGDLSITNGSSLKYVAGPGTASDITYYTTNSNLAFCNATYIAEWNNSVYHSASPSSYIYGIGWIEFRNTTDTSDGIYIFSDSDNNRISLNNITKFSRDGIRIENSEANLPERNNITGNFILNATNNGIFVNNTLAASQLFENNNITYSGINYSAILLNNASNITVIGGILENNTLGINASGSINITVANVTFRGSALWDFYIANNSWVTGLNNSFNHALVNVTNDASNFTVQWYVDVNVTQADESFSAVAGATVYAYENTTGAWTQEWTESTAASGFTGKWAVTEYVQNGTTIVNYTSNFTATKLTKANSTIKYITSSQQVDVRIPSPTKFCNGNYTDGSDWVIGRNITCANETIPVAGNITILNNGSLTLYNVTINFSAFADGSNFINKSPNGGLFIYDLDSNASTQEDATEIISNNSDYEYDFWAYGNGLNDNLTIKNSKFTDAGYSTKSQGIQLYNVSNVKVIGNNVSGGALNGLYLQYSTNNNISSNTITTSGSTGRGIWLDLSSNSNTLQSNTITTSGITSVGIYLLSGSNSNTLQSNTITTSNTWSFGIYLSSSSNSNTLQSNTITTNGTGGNGIYLDLSSNNNATSNIINATGTNADGIYILSNSDNNILNLNNITKSGRDGIRIEGSTNERNNITNNIILNATEHGIFANNTLTASQLIQDNNISYSGNFSILLSNASNITIIGGSLEYSKIGINATSSINVTVTNATFVLNTLWDFYITNNSWVISLNNSFNKSGVNVTNYLRDFSNFTNQYYVDVNVTWSNDSVVSGATVYAYENTTGSWSQEWTDTTTATGFTGKWATTEYTQNGTTVVNYTSNFTATASGTANSTIKYITSSQQADVRLNATAAPPSNVTFNITFLITKVLAPDMVMAASNETINVTTTVKVNKTTNDVSFINITDEIPYDFIYENESRISVLFINWSDAGSNTIDITANVTKTIIKNGGTANTWLIINISNMSTSLGYYMTENDSIQINYLMNSSKMNANDTRIVYTNVTVKDIASNEAADFKLTNITSSQIVLRGYKKISVDPANPQNVTVGIEMQSLGGKLTSILLVDYLPNSITAKSQLVGLNVTYYNKTSNSYKTLTEPEDYKLYNPYNSTLPDNQAVSVFSYNFSYNFTNWDGTIYENDSLLINYSIAIAGGGSWVLPAIIGGWDPQYQKHIKTQMYTQVSVPSFDVITKVLTPKIKPGEAVKALLQMLNVGGPKAKVDVFVTYSMKTMQGELITERSETLAVVEQKEKELLLPTPSTVKPGMYTFETFVTYTGREAVSTDVFEVLGEKGSGFSAQWLMFGIFGLVMVLIIIFVIIRTRKK